MYISKICSYKEVCKILLKEYGPNTLNTFQMSRHCTHKQAVWGHIQSAEFHFPFASNALPISLWISQFF